MKNTRLIEARRAAGLTQVEVANKAGITDVCYQRYEAGQRIPRVDVAIKIALAVNDTVENLFRQEYHKPNRTR